MNIILETLKNHLEYVKTIKIQPNQIWKLFQKLHPKETEELIKNTSFLDLNKRNRKVTFFERIFCVINNVTELPKCKQCHEKEVDFDRHHGGSYKDYCCNSCAQLSPETQEKIKNTYDKNPSLLENRTKKMMKTKEKNLQKDPHYYDHQIELTKKTKKDKYGDENYCNVDQIKRTKKDKFGDENFNNREKAYETMMREYGVKQYSNPEKISQTKLNYSQERKDEIRDRKVKTTRKHFGVDYIFQLPGMVEHIQDLCEQRTGYRLPFLSPEARIKNLKQLRKKVIDKINEDDEYDFADDVETFLTCKDKERKWKIRHKCGHVFETSFNGSLHDDCPKCYEKILHKSQHRVFEFLNSLDCFDDLRENCRGILTFGEIDIYSKHSKFAVEYDGMVYHAFEDNVIRNVKGKPINYHLQKTVECEEMGIRLFHITDFEWNRNEKLCRSILKESLGMTRRKIDVVKCQIVEIDVPTKDRFLEKYTFQGSDFSGIRLGIFFGKRLVGIMTLKRKGDCLQIVRLGKVNNFSIPGMIRSFCSYVFGKFDCSRIVLKMDRRFHWKDSVPYGFQVVKELPPNYHWFSKGVMFDKVNFHRDRFSDYDDGKSFIENMNAHGFYRFYDCGKIVCEMKRPS